MSERAHLSNGGVDIYFEVVDGALLIRYWGESLMGDPATAPFHRSIPNSDFDEMMNPGLMREQSRGWLGAPTISGHRNGRSWSTKFEVTKLQSSNSELSALLRDATANLELEINGRLDEFGVFRLGYELINNGDEYTLNELSYWLPLSRQANQTLDFVGRWSNERNPQRREIGIGRWLRESHEGRGGHNGTIGEIALTRETNFSSGAAWAVALAWSGDTRYCIEKNYEGTQSIGASELLAPGEVILKKGERYRAPDLVAVFSNRGLDGLASGYHAHLRARKSHPKSPRPLTLNMWEAIYFDHSQERVRKLVDVAAEIGVERVVLDDGWFGSRRSDRAGLGDWHVSPEVWPNGLGEISEYVASKGMQFGLWFEGEMVNPDSDLYRNHPDWILSENGHNSPTWRHELVLDLAKPEVFSHILESVSAVVEEASVKYIKWDHNRILIDAGSDGRPGARAQVSAIYRLFGELKSRHRGLEIESCASGGGRIDLGMADFTDRFWTSDNNDALERQHIQRWTMQFIPPELLGTHIGPTPGHQTGRLLSLPFRAITALFGHAGIEWDITQLDKVELEQLKNWISFYKAKRTLLHSGDVLRMDYPDDHHHLYGVISKDKSSGLFAFAQLRPIPTSHAPNLQLRGLDPARNYRVKVVTPAGTTGFMLIAPPPWLQSEFITTGSILAAIGLPAPILRPAEALLIEVEAI